MSIQKSARKNEAGSPQLCCGISESETMTKLRHYDNEGTARFVTFGCYHNLPFLSDDSARLVFLEELDRARTNHGFKTGSP